MDGAGRGPRRRGPPGPRRAGRRGGPDRAGAEAPAARVVGGGRRRDRDGLQPGIGGKGPPGRPTRCCRGAGGGGAGARVVADAVVTVAALVLDEHEGMDAAALKEHEEVTKVKNVRALELGKYRMDTWYGRPRGVALRSRARRAAGRAADSSFASSVPLAARRYFSPLPKELLQNKGGVLDVLFVDEFSLDFFARKEELLRHQRKAALGRGGTAPPPGERDLPAREPEHPFLFYVLCELDKRGGCMSSPLRRVSSLHRLVFE